MEFIFKLFAKRLIKKTEELFKLVKQKPMMSDNYLLSVVFIDFSKLKPKRELNTIIYIQIMLIYVNGWLEKYFEKEDDNQKDECKLLLLIWFYKYLTGSNQLQVINDNEFIQLSLDIAGIITSKSISETEKGLILQMGKWNAAYDLDENETDVSLISILHEWMQFKVPK